MYSYMIISNLLTYMYILVYMNAPFLTHNGLQHRKKMPTGHMRVGIQ